MSGNSDQIVENLFRSAYGTLVSILTGIFGLAHIQLAEDVVQDTLISALNHWSTGDMPDNPMGWLVTVAKRKALNELKRLKMMEKHHLEYFAYLTEVEQNNIYLEEELVDSQLKMIFTCCHPALNRESQIALTLKTLCGFGIKEVANALLTSESTINKRLYRAKMIFRNSDLSFEIPKRQELNNRLEMVELTLYLLFNEGYNSTSSEMPIRKELCLEAVRLTNLLALHFKSYHRIHALLSLMCFHAARFDSRIDDQGAIILFEDQNRATWNRELINVGFQHLQMSKGSSALSAYHVEASIAAQHCMAKSFNETNWQEIYAQYKILEKIKPNPIIQLNLAIIQSKISGLESSLKLLASLTDHKKLKNYFLLPATMGVFHMKLKNFTKAIHFLNKAIRMNPPVTQKEYLQNKVATCKRNNSRN